MVAPNMGNTKKTKKKKVRGVAHAYRGVAYVCKAWHLCVRHHIHMKSNVSYGLWEPWDSPSPYGQLSAPKISSLILPCLVSLIALVLSVCLPQSELVSEYTCLSLSLYVQL